MWQKCRQSVPFNCCNGRIVPDAAFFRYFRRIENEQILLVSLLIFARLSECHDLWCSGICSFAFNLSVDCHQPAMLLCQYIIETSKSIYYCYFGYFYNRHWHLVMKWNYLPWPLRSLLFVQQKKLPVTGISMVRLFHFLIQYEITNKRRCCVQTKFF